MAVEVSKVVRTLRLKVKREGYAWLNAAAIEVNQVWNFANQTAFRAVDSPCPRPYKWLSAFDLDKITAGACKYFEHIGSDTIQRANAEYAIRRNQIKKRKLRWRVSDGPKRALGWIPFKAVQLKRKGTSLRFAGKTLRVFQREKLEGVTFGCGCFAQDSVGDWWLSLPVEYALQASDAPHEAVGLDLGLKNTVATSDGETLSAGNFYRNIEQQIAQAQRRGHKRQSKRLHRAASRRRKDRVT